MKRLFFATCMMLGFAGIASAQITTATSATKATAVKPATAVVTPTAVTKPVVAKAATATPVKADGTPDMRFKANKTTTKPATGPKKADGTPDMRFKTNKTTTKPVVKPAVKPVGN